MNRTRSRRSALSFLGAATIAPSAVFAQAAKVRIGLSPTESAGLGFVGVDSGIFAQHGLDVELTFFSNSSQIAVAAAAGAVDVGIADMIQLGSAVTRGVPLVFFAGGSTYLTTNPTALMCVDRNAPFTSVQELAGKTIGVVALNSVSSLAVTEWLHQNGVDPATVKLFEMPIPTMAPGLARGTISAAHISEPFLSAAKGDVRVVGKAYDAIAKRFYINAWFSTRDWLAKDPATTRRLTEAIYATARWANANHDASAPIVAKYTKIELSGIRAMARATFATSLDPLLMQPVLDLAWRYHDLDRPIVAQTIMAPIAG